MGKLFTPQDISSGFNTTNSLNTNFDNIETALDRTLSRYADAPNAMQTDLDLNNNDLINAGLVSCDALEVGGAEVPSLQSLQDLLDGTETSLQAQVDLASGFADSASSSATQAVTAQGLAEAAQAAAELAAESVGLPVIGLGDAGKALIVNALEDGYEYSTLPADPDGAITARLATQAEAETGSNNTQLMTPLRVKQAVTHQIQNEEYEATTTTTGTSSLATTAQVQSALDGATAFTSPTAEKVVTLGALDAALKTNTSSRKLDIGNLLIQSGRTAATGTDTSITFPTAYTVTPVVVITCEDEGNSTLGSSGNIGSTFGTTGFNVRHSSAVNWVHWIAFSL